MRQHNIRWMLLISAGFSCLMASAAAFSAVEGTRLIGLAMHQDTGRNIYIGALHYDDQIPTPENLISATGPRAMEYRVVARRTSIRSLMGSMLLQGELATGTPPSASTSLFVEDIMDAVKGSLYAGDTLQLTLNKDNTTVATLDGHQVASSDDRAVADYLLMGWVGEGGPSTAFRTSILAPEIDGAMLSIYGAHTPSEDRIAAIEEWSTSSSSSDDKLIPVTKALAAATIAASASAAVVAPAVEKAEVETQLAEATPTETTVANKEVKELDPNAPSAEPVLLASVTPSREMIQPTMEEINAADKIEAMEYSQRLANFNTFVLKSVYAHIRYPKSAVRRNIQGQLELDLSMNKAGELLDVTIAVTSGHSLLDKSAVKAAKKAFENTPIKDMDQVAISEYSEDGDALVIPIPVSFILTE